MTKLREALDDLRTNGWFKGESTNRGDRQAVFLAKHGPNPTCMYIATERKGELQYEKDIFALAEVCVEQFPERALGGSTSAPSSLVIYTNNHPDTTFEDVEMLMEKAALSRESEI